MAWSWHGDELKGELIHVILPKHGDIIWRYHGGTSPTLTNKIRGF